MWLCFVFARIGHYTGCIGTKSRDYHLSQQPENSEDTKFRPPQTPNMAGNIVAPR